MFIKAISCSVKEQAVFCWNFSKLTPFGLKYTKTKTKEVQYVVSSFRASHSCFIYNRRPIQSTRMLLFINTASLDRTLQKKLFGSWETTPFPLNHIMEAWAFKCFTLDLIPQECTECKRLYLICCNHKKGQFLKCSLQQQ